MRMYISGTSVEWDDKKNSINKKKHGISFESAALVFADMDRVEYYDMEHSTIDEDRYVVIGRGKMCCLSFTLCVMTLQGLFQPA